VLLSEEPGRIFTRNFLLLSGYGMLALGLSLMLVTGLPLYLQGRGWDPQRLGATLGAYFLTSMVVRPFVGREADRRGRKAILVSGALLMLLPCPLYMFSTTGAVLALRIVQGVGWAMATTATAAMASEIVPPDRVGTGMGIFGILNSLGFTFGPALGAHLLNVGGSKAFLVAATFLGVGILACAVLIDPPPSRGSMALSWGEAGVLAHTLARPLMVALAASFGYGVVQTFLPLYARGSGVSNPGVFFTIFSLLSFASRPAFGRLSDLWGRRSAAAVLVVVIAAAFSLLAYSATLPFLSAAGVLYGIGHGAIYTVLMALLADLTLRKDRGLAFGIFGTSIDLGISCGNLAIGALVASIGFSGSFLLSAAVVAASLPVLLIGAPAPAIAPTAQVAKP
jgi:MFS family permease